MKNKVISFLKWFFLNHESNLITLSSCITAYFLYCTIDIILPTKVFEKKDLVFFYVIMCIMMFYILYVWYLLRKEVIYVLSINMGNKVGNLIKFSGDLSKLENEAIYYTNLCISLDPDFKEKYYKDDEEWKVTTIEEAELFFFYYSPKFIGGFQINKISLGKYYNLS